MSIWDWLLNPAGLTAHGFCLSWAPGLVALHAGSDAIIGLAYFSIPLAMGWFLLERRDLKHRQLAYLFAAFILACGATHIFSILTLWAPVYGLEGLMKALTAILSIITAIALWPLVPKLLLLPTPGQLESLNKNLFHRICENERITALLRESEIKLLLVNSDLEQQVEERTSALETEIAARREADERFRQVTEFAPTAIIMVDEAGKIELVNLQTERTFGYARDELLGRSIDILLPEHLRAGHRHHRLEFFGSSSARTMGIGMNLLARRKDGGEFPVEVAISPLKTPNGQQVIASISDISKRVEMELEMREHDEQMRLMFESIQEHAIFMIDVEGRVLSWNVGAERLTGYASSEIMGQNFSIFYSKGEEAVEAAQQDLRIAAADGRVESEGWRIRKDGTPFLANSIISAISDSRGLLRGFVQITRDISDRKRIESELVESNERYALAARAAGLGFWTYHVETQTLRWDERMFELYGVCPQQGEQPYDFWTTSLHVNDRKTAEELFLDALAGKRTFDTEFRIVRPDGQIRHIRANATVKQGSHTGVTHMFGVNADITERKEAQLSVERARDEAQTANRAKSAFLASMSHEIRTPMNGVIGFAELLLDSGLTMLQTSYTTRLLEAAKSLISLMNDILDLSKIEAGKLEVESIPMHPEVVLNGAISIVRAQADAKGIELRVEIAPEVSQWVKSDPTRIRQILLNLLSNALKFTDRGHIIVRSFCESTGQKKFLRFEVEDTGIGIPDDRLHLLFHDFSQVDSSTTRRYGGTGLGLSICKRLAEALGGGVGVSSVAGVGSKIWFTIELRICQAPDFSATPDLAAHVAGGARVLLADDLQMNRDIIEAMLKRAGYSVQGVENGREAITAIQEGEFDVVLMDMEMPEMDGLDATRAIRRLHESRRSIPIVALTANAYAEDRERCRAAGMNDFLPKPIDSEGLLRMVEKWSAMASAD